MLVIPGPGYLPLRKSEEWGKGVVREGGTGLGERLNNVEKVS